MEVVAMYRIAGYAAPIEPGAVDPVQACILAAAHAVAAGQALVCDPETGALLLVDPDYESDAFDEDDMPVGVADVTPPSIAMGEPPDHAVLPDELALVEDPSSFDEWEAELWSGDEQCEGVSWDGPRRENELWDEQARKSEPGYAAGGVGGPAAASGAFPLPGAAEMPDEPGVRVPRRLQAGMESLPGGAELACALESVQLDEIGAYELVEFVAACQRMSSAMDALQASAVGELGRRVEMRPGQGVRTESMTPGRITELEVGARLMTSDDQAGRLVSRAMLICEQLPDTYVLWRSGVLSTEKVDVMVAKLARVDAELAREVEARVLPGAVNRTAASLRRQITRLLHKLAPKPAKKRHEENKAERFARITPAPDGMAWLEAYLTAEDAAAVKAALDAGAATLKRHDDALDAGVSGKGTANNPASSGGNPGAGSFADGAGFADGADSSSDVTYRRTAGNRRADVLAALAWAALSTGWIGGCDCGNGKGGRDSKVRGDGSGGFGLSAVRGRPVTVNVTVPLSSLLGEGEEPGELAGFGPITAESARRLAASGTWRRIVTDPLSGAVLDVGRTRYTPPRELADHVMARDQRCRWPTCDRPATGVGIELDHTVAFEDGGTTAHTNLGVFCDKNHVDKHQAGWTVTQPEPGRFVYTSPTGHVYTVDPEPIGPAHGDAVGAPPPF